MKDKQETPIYRTIEDAEACDSIMSMDRIRRMSSNQRTNKMMVLSFGLQQFMGKDDPMFRSLSLGYEVALKRLLAVEDEERAAEEKIKREWEDPNGILRNPKPPVRDESECGIYTPCPSEGLTMTFILGAAFVFLIVAVLITWLQFGH